MFDFISDCKQTIIKYKKQLLTVALVPVFMFRSSLSGFALTSNYYNTPIRWYDSEVSLQFYNGSWSSTFLGSYNSDGNSYYFNNSALSSSTQFKVFSTYQTLDTVLPYDVPLKFVYYFYSNDVSNLTDLNISFQRSDIMYGDNQYLNCSQFTTVYNFSDRDTNGIVVLIDLPGNFLFEQPNGFRIVSSSNFSVPVNCVFSGAIYNGNDVTTSDIVTAINNQTNSIMNAGSGYGGTSSDILSGNDELSDYIDDYTQIEQTMHNNFESAQSALIGDFTGFTWGSLANTLNWTSDYMQQIYLNSGDFKMMIILPLLLGIALFFIGRGAIILSNSNKDN